MQALRDWPLDARRAVRGVFTDIDDTLTSDGAITPDALNALHVLRQAGLHVIPITGRPVGWCAPLIGSWPVDAIVAENGAVALLPDGGKKIYQQDESTRRINFARMRQVADRILREVPGATLARDSALRETDIAVDHAEHEHLDAEAVAQVVAIAHEEGMNASVSSIHVNAWFGAHDKLAGARWIVHTLWGRTLDAEQLQWAYVGDSANDQVMFAAFDNAIAVANIRTVAASLHHPPRYVTEADRGAGFAEFVRALLARS